MGNVLLGSLGLSLTGGDEVGLKAPLRSNFVPHGFNLEIDKLLFFVKGELLFEGRLLLQMRIYLLLTISFGGIGCCLTLESTSAEIWVVFDKVNGVQLLVGISREDGMIV